MRLSTAKDIILKTLVSQDGSYQQLIKSNRIDKHTVMAALDELKSEGYIDTLETSCTGTGNIKVYEPTQVHPKSAHFVKENHSFRKRAILKWVADFPKNYWFVITLIASLGFNIREIIKYFLR